jgi:nucleotide-binding universal stress UspA family protein
MYRRIVIPLDGSKTAEKVLSYARVLAKNLAVPVELLNVIDITALAKRVAPEQARYLDTIIAEDEHRCRVYLRDVARSFSGAGVQCVVKRGNPADVIIACANEVKGTLIAMATHGRSGLNRWWLGSVAEEVLRGTGAPVLLIRGNEEGGLGAETVIDSAVIPLDGSELAEGALTAAAELAKMLDLEIVLFRAYELPASAYYGSEDYLPNYDQLKEQVKQQVQSYLADKMTKLKAQGVTRVSSVIVEGAGPNEIVGYARKIPNNLVAMCTHGRSGLKRLVLGSVTEKVVRHSGDPVLVLRAE